MFSWNIFIGWQLWKLVSMPFPCHLCCPLVLCDRTPTWNTMKCVAINHSQYTCGLWPATDYFNKFIFIRFIHVFARTIPILCCAWMGMESAGRDVVPNERLIRVVRSWPPMPMASFWFRSFELVPQPGIFYLQTRIERWKTSIPKMKRRKYIFSLFRVIYFL